MNHKKQGLLLLLIICLSSLKVAKAQEFYFCASGSYALPYSQAINTNLTTGLFTNNNQQLNNGDFGSNGAFAFINYNRNQTVTYYYNASVGSNVAATPVTQGLGQGGGFMISAGYATSKNIGFELGFSYVAGNTLKSTLAYTNNNYTSDTNVSAFTLNSQMQTNPHYRLMPMVRISAPFSKINLYLKAGLVMGFGSTITVANSFINTNYSIQYGYMQTQPGETLNNSATASGGISWGYIASAGAEYKITNWLYAFAEATVIADKWSPTKGVVNSFNEDGSAVTIASPNFTYSNTSNNTTTNSPAGPYVLTVSSSYPSFTVNFNSIGAMVGVRLILAKKHIEQPAEQK